MHRFKTQSILCATTLNCVALEVLSKHKLSFDDEHAMLEADMAALEYASRLVDQTSLRVHCNMEYMTMLLAPWRMMRDYIKPGLVIEFVERNELLLKSDVCAWIKEISSRIRRNGGMVALDDIEMNAMEYNLIKTFQPEIIKVCRKGALQELLGVVDPKSIRIITEHIESEENAITAKQLGAHEIQGYWCDNLVARDERQDDPVRGKPAIQGAVGIPGLQAGEDVKCCCGADWRMYRHQDDGAHPHRNRLGNQCHGLEDCWNHA